MVQARLVFPVKNQPDILSELSSFPSTDVAPAIEKIKPQLLFYKKRNLFYKKYQSLLPGVDKLSKVGQLPMETILHLLQ